MNNTRKLITDATNLFGVRVGNYQTAKFEHGNRWLITTVTDAGTVTVGIQDFDNNRFPLYCSYLDGRVVAGKVGPWIETLEQALASKQSKAMPTDEETARYNRRMEYATAY